MWCVPANEMCFLYARWILIFLKDVEKYYSPQVPPSLPLHLTPGGRRHHDLPNCIKEMAGLVM